MLKSAVLNNKTIITLGVTAIKIKILGTEYEIVQKDRSEDPLLEEREGYCDNSVKKIVICNIKKERGSKEDLKTVKRKILRHEIIHAFFFESGLDVNSEWGSDETLVDWIALQFPKMEKVFKAAGCMK